MSPGARHHLIALGALGLALAGAPTARAAELSLAVFIPQATFADNATRAAYASKLAAALTAASHGEASFRGRAFARRGDLETFLRAGKVDLLVADAVFAAHGVRGRVIAHAVGPKGSTGPAAVLYASEGVKDTLALRGAPVALPDAGAQVGLLYANTALAGEVNPSKLFGALRPSRDAAAALGAVKAGKAKAAFAPAGNPAATGLRALARGGHVPMAVAVDTGRLDADLRERLVGALVAGAGRGGGVAGWRAGPGGAIEGLLRAPKVDRAKVKLSPSDLPVPPPPALRLRPTADLPPPEVGAATYEPTIPEEP